MCQKRRGVDRRLPGHAAPFRECHIVCLPSYREGMPKVLLEACATGRAVVTSDSPGCRDVVRAGENGLLVPPRDSRALAAAIRDLLTDPLRRQRMGRQGRVLAEREFGVDGVNQKHLEIYWELLGRSSPPVVMTDNLRQDASG